jgi:hypothetical protein
VKPIAAIACLILLTTALAGCGDDNTAAPPTVTVTETITPPAAEGATGEEGETDFAAEPCPGADSPPNIAEVTSYGADCGAVEDAMSKVGSISREFTLGDFECSRVEGSSLAGTWECRGEASHFTFEFAD